MANDKYLLDTNCFYAVRKNKVNQDKFRALSPQITTSIMAIMEIANIERDQKVFLRRKEAMLALSNIEPIVHNITPDDIVAESFGQPSYKPGSINYEEIIWVITHANNYDHAVNGIIDKKRGIRHRLNPQEIKQWKKHFSDFFVGSMVSGNQKTIEMLIELLKEQGYEGNERELRKEAKLLNSMVSSHEKARLYTIAGLAVRAKLFTEEELAEAIETDNMDRFAMEANKKYIGNLEPFIRMYLELQKYISDGRKPEKNSVFDLEFFLHLDAHNTQFTFVTTEDIWIELGSFALPGRVIRLTDLLNRCV